MGGEGTGGGEGAAGFAGIVAEASGFVAAVRETFLWCGTCLCGEGDASTERELLQRCGNCFCSAGDASVVRGLLRRCGDCFCGLAGLCAALRALPGSGFAVPVAGGAGFVARVSGLLRGHVLVKAWAVGHLWFFRG